MDTFFELLQIAIGKRDKLTSVPASREEWEALMKVTGEHNLLGITFPVIDALHDEVEVPLGVYSRWAMVAERVRQQNGRHKEACKHLYEWFLENGYRSSIFKGQAAALLYPDPSLRQCGDIDIWLDGERDTIVQFLRERFPVKKVLYLHCDVQMLKGISVEVHFTPSWMHSPFKNRRMQNYFSSVSAEQFTNFNETLGCCIPTRRFNAVYMLIHLCRHVLNEGIGLRQFLDYYYLLQNLDESDRLYTLAVLKDLGLLRFTSGVMYILKDVFCLEDEFLLLPPNGNLGRLLLEEILLSGNFGRFDPRNNQGKEYNRFKHIRYRITRGLRFLRLLPGEVLWMPYYMVWQYFWRRRHGYLYKGR